MIITLEFLKKHGACKDQVKLFKKLFSNKVELTEENIMEYGNQFNLTWLAMEIFTDSIREKYETDIALNREKFEADTAPIRKKFNTDIAPIFWKYL